ncbi:D-glycero-beta-D-manno-heptose 1-phosphate adenylyltransferase [Fulvivirga sedimenti]|uniref:D-glycero-beta-D-manno-heptose 1-phosphate adenylyltransferase n=1 Tax=Fulvivirga sedimenti TaxID=2879465 RepID=A0A9X1HLD2_9BACT|nr:D-glycero-beta-D-manno-heptose 1-phosphate adenylyltransferase [Fulvivirga sedimenti]MCA6074379.1 D-glycero-beta-D-manno-heptose 1-phosphate adenylyltransferase [Fulvivirga sedimenti]
MSTSHKILTTGEADQLIRQWKGDHEKIVFTNGCFDIMHVGHLDYLEAARQLGDHLIIGVNTDDSVRRLKGSNRPINDAYSRTRLLASLEFVDAVILFDEDTPYDLIKRVKPDILVKGDDYLTENIVGADIVIAAGGEVKTLPFTEGYSSTSIIERIRTIN